MSTNYLQYDADSIINLLKFKIQQSENFSDQLFTGSNLTIILETLSVMFEHLTYTINTESTEASFGDTTLYDSINKLVKMLSYNPRSSMSASVPALQFLMEDNTTLSNTSNSTKILNKFIKFKAPTTKSVDDNGNEIYYSLVEDYTVLYNKASETLTAPDTITFYNGFWKKHPNVYSTSGISNETFELNVNQVTNPISDLKLLAYYIDGDNYIEYTAVRNLFDYTSSDKVFEVRVNESANLTIRFGDGANGELLPVGKTLFFVYLISNGIDGQIGKDLINNSTISVNLDYGIDGINDSDVINILGIDSIDKRYLINETNFNNILVQISESSTTYQPIETVEQIKNNAPIEFRSGSKLIINNDFKNYIEKYYSDSVHDVSVMNNWDYMSIFQKWLYDLDKLTPLIVSLGYKYSDSCDFNNIYMWLKSTTSGNVSNFTKNSLDKNMRPIKATTSDTVFLDALNTYIFPYIGDTPIDIESNENWPNTDTTKIQIIRDPNSLVSIESIKRKVLKIFTTYFSIDNLLLGHTLDASDIYNQILSLNGVKSVKTYKNSIYITGIQLAKWTNTIVTGSDFATFTGSYKLEEFQFPKFYNIDMLEDIIEIIDSNYSTIGTEY